ncbi:hypothetical protein [Akkermansia muciniphila]|uniref:hypothetical protein n=1 Tax=Akkermansia muciniphila TaxID=239935 RepID=UPI001BFEFEEE|nr:hypothetical protein [Akkermansia muciniphila]MBT8778300.1 hypothetical protein [Akkermansia muciniphila]
MSKVPHMDEPLVDILELGRWMAENHVSRSALASAIGMNRSAIDNYFVRKKLSRHAQILIRRFMDGQESVGAAREVSSLITVPLSNRVLNLAMKTAVRQNLTMEEFLARAVEAAAKNPADEKEAAQ